MRPNRLVRGRAARFFTGLAVIATSAALIAPAEAKGCEAGEPVSDLPRSAAYRDLDESITALNILPPGQGTYEDSAGLALAQAVGGQPDENVDQIRPYESLIQGYRTLTPKSLARRYYKDASFGVPADRIMCAYSPRDGVIVLRDPWRVPHVYGETRGDAMFGLGYVSAEDRLFMMDVLRHLGRARLSEFLGPSPSNLAMDAAQFKAADYTEEELYGLGQRLVGLDPVLGRQVLNDVVDYSDGINAFLQEARIDPTLLPGEYAALQIVPDPWRPTDTAAAATVIGGAFGFGGGGELRNAAFLEALEQEGYSPREARAIFDDLHQINDPEAPTTTDRRFPWNQNLGPVDPRSVARPDDSSGVYSSIPQPPSAIDGPFGPIPLFLPRAASNALLVSAPHSASGRPIAVFGPQTGYWSPEILMEVDVHAPGLHGRGAAFPGISLYVLLGRGPGWGWSATSAGADQMDIYAHELCDPLGGTPELNSQYYLRGDRCVPMYTRTDTFVAKPTAGGVPSSPADVVISRTTERTNLGIVQARGTVDGKPVAFVSRRASYGAELDNAIAFVEIMDPDTFRGARHFQRAFGRFTYTFNWFYVDDKDIAFQLAGLNPIRPEGVDLDLPVWADRRWGWQGYLPFKDVPKDLNPAKGYFANWNNWQAPGFRVSDTQWSYGPVHRSLLLDDRVRREVREGDVTIVELVQAMEDAATVDLRGDKVLPWMLEVVGDSPDGRLRRAVRLLSEWHRNGAHRADLEKPLDGVYDHAPAVALMDEWWSRALEAVFRPALGKAFDDVPVPQDDAPGPVGSAYNNGWYGQLQKDLRMVLGEPVAKSFSRIYCGRGNLEACRRLLTASLEEAVSALETEFGYKPATWQADEAGDEIQFSPLGVQEQRPMQWQNRPTFQQVLEFGRRVVRSAVEIGIIREGPGNSAHYM